MERILGDRIYLLPAGDALEVLDVDPAKGLDLLEVQARQERFGPNSLPAAAGISPWRRFLFQFHQPLVYILLAAAAITFVLHEWVDSAVILGVVLVNAVIGFLQESKAAQALEALAKTDKTPADVRLFQCKDLQVDEAALTGESVAVQKHIEELTAPASLGDRKNLAFSSTLVTYGQGRGVVYATGQHTEVGKISNLISTADVLETPLTRRIAQFSRLLLGVILALAAVTFVIGVIRDQPVIDIFMAAVALAVAAIPEGLPAAVTIILAIGVARMADLMDNFRLWGFSLIGVSVCKLAMTPLIGVRPDPVNLP